MIEARRTGTWDLDGLSADLTAANRTLGRELAATIRTEITDAARTVGVPARFRNMGGAKLSLRARTFAGPTRVTVDVTPSPPGAWAIVEHGTSGHQVRPRRARALGAPGGPYARVEVRGIPGRHGWTRAAAAADDKIGEQVETVFDRALDV